MDCAFPVQRFWFYLKDCSLVFEGSYGNIFLSLAKMSDPGGQVDENGVYKNASLGKAAGRTKNGTFAIKPVPKVHIDPSDAVFLLKGSRPFGRRKGGPLLDELAISKENMRKEAEAEAEKETEA